MIFTESIFSDLGEAAALISIRLEVFSTGMTHASSRKERTVVGGLVASIVVFAIGAILDFAVTVNPDQHGFDVRTVGVILMIVAAVGALLSIMGFVSSGIRHHRTVIDDGRGNVIRRDDSYI